MIRRSVKERLKAGEFVIGTWCILPSPHISDILARSGLDFQIIDMEHGQISPETMSGMAMAIGSQCETFVRVPNDDQNAISHALDCGAAGVIVPHIESVKDRETAVAASKYPPLGSRGFSPFVRAEGYTSSAVDTNARNKELLTGIMIEGKSGLENLDKIIDDENIDLVYIGTYDLSVALGVPGEVNSQKVQSVLEDVVKRLRENGKAAGCMANDIAGIKKLKDMGVQFLLYKVDSSIIFDNARSAADGLKSMLR